MGEGPVTNRTITVAAAQLGPIQKSEPGAVAVQRMIRLMEHAHKRGVELVVFPELALTTCFPRHCHADITEADHRFETVMPSNETAPLFDAARRYGIGFHLDCADLAATAIGAQGRHVNRQRSVWAIQTPPGQQWRP
jgi:N-carbamoyl-D-amino-acid hydrolase